MKGRKLTHFNFFKNTPLTNFVDTIYFESNTERDKFFIKNYESINLSLPFNFLKDKLTVRVTGNIKDFKDVNYCRFKYGFDNITYYCFIPEYEYLNDNTIELKLVIDGIMTFCQGDVLNDLRNITVIREHLTTNDYYKNLKYLKNNDDVIKTYTKQYFKEEKTVFKDFNVLIHSTVDLAKDLGDKNNPNLATTTGANVDRVTSPVDLYIIDKQNFNSLMYNLQDYPWITQNFTKIILIPKEFLDKDMEHLKTKKVDNPKIDMVGLHKITGGIAHKDNPKYLEKVNKSNDELLELFGLDEEDEHLLRNEYTTIECYNYGKDHLFIDTGQLNRKNGLEFKVDNISGYFNEVMFYIKGYKANEHLSSYINDSIRFDTFDEIPILVDNYKLALSKNTHQRNLAQQNTLTGKVERMFDNENDIQDRFVASISVLSSITSISSIGNMLIDDYNYYRQLQASEKDLALTPNTTTNQTGSNALNIKTDNYGLVVKYSKPDKEEFEKVKRYYKLFGYHFNEYKGQLSDTRSMKYCNYVQFKGNYTIPNAERSIEDSIKVLFENGVRLWHNRDVANPFNTVEILANKRVK